MSLKDELNAKSGIRTMEREFAEIYKLYIAKENLSTEAKKLLHGMEIAIEIIGYYEEQLAEQKKSNSGEMSPKEAIELMKSLGMKNAEIKELVKDGIKNGSK